MIWIWVAIGVVVLAVLLLLLVTLGTMRRLRPFQVAASDPALPRDVALLSGRLTELQRATQDVAVRAQVAQERLVDVKASWSAEKAGRR